MNIMNMDCPQIGVVGVIRDADRWLMIQRSDHVVAPQMVLSRRGEPGETQADAVVRELREELSLTVQPIRPVWEWTRPDGRLQLHWWDACILDGTPRPNPAEVRDVRWMTVGEIRALSDVLPNLLPFLDHVAANGHES